MAFVLAGFGTQENRAKLAGKTGKIFMIFRLQNQEKYRACSPNRKVLLSVIRTTAKIGFFGCHNYCHHPIFALWGASE